jgi:uncharacterized protein YkwD
MDLENNPSAPINTTPQNSEMIFVVNPVELAEFTNRIRQRLNTLRSNNGLTIVNSNSALNTLAQDHTQYMATTGVLAHTNNLGALSTQYGYNWRALGENIAYGSQGANATASADFIFNLWQNSAPHLANMLNPVFRDVGLGYVRANGLVWSTMILGTPA